jgi:hypothetical protein
MGGAFRVKSSNVASRADRPNEFNAMPATNTVLNNFSFSTTTLQRVACPVVRTLEQGTKKLVLSQRVQHKTEFRCAKNIRPGQPRGPDPRQSKSRSVDLCHPESHHHFSSSRLVLQLPNGIDIVMHNRPVDQYMPCPDQAFREQGHHETSVHLRQGA